MPDVAHDIVLFDGVCNLCESTVRFIIRRDRAANFRFCPLQSDVAKMLLKKHDFSDDALDSVLLLSNGVVHRKSRAALRIARKLDGAWPVFFYLFHWLPALVADPVYDFIGNRRYKWFGMKNACWIPDAELQQRFIGD